MHWGTLGPAGPRHRPRAVDRHPLRSKWMHQVTGAPRPDVDPDLVGVFNDFDQYAALPPERRDAAAVRAGQPRQRRRHQVRRRPHRSRPRWLDPGRPPVQEVPGASPRGVPPAMRWRPLTTFLQTLIDMKNAQVPGAYRACAHDYRPDLARFISDVYDLPASDEQMTRVEQALEKREAARERLFSAPRPDPTPTSPCSRGLDRRISYAGVGDESQALL